MSKLLLYLNQLKNKKEKTEERNQKRLIEIKDLLRGLEKIGGKILSLSKKGINAAVNGNLPGAEESLKDAEKIVNEFIRGLSKIRARLANILKGHRVTTNDFQDIYSKIKIIENDFSQAMEEFFEAKITYLYFRDAGKSTYPNLFNCSFEIYAGALADFCGELLRRARLDIINDVESTANIKAYYRDAKSIHDVLSSFSFSNSSGVRSKMEHVKGYIQKFEKILYDLKIADLRRNNNYFKRA